MRNDFLKAAANVVKFTMMTVMLNACVAAPDNNVLKTNQNTGGKLEAVYDIRAKFDKIAPIEGGMGQRFLSKNTRFVPWTQTKSILQEAGVIYQHTHVGGGHNFRQIQRKYNRQEGSPLIQNAVEFLLDSP